MSNIESVSTDLYDNTSIIKTIGDNSSLFLLVFFILVVVLSFFSIVAILLALIAKMYKARCIIHFAWCIYCFLMILGFLIGAILNPLSVMMVEVCDYLDGFLTDQEFFKNSQAIAAGQSKDLMETCIFGDANLFKFLELDDQLSELSTLVESMQKQGEKIEETKSSYNYRRVRQVMDENKMSFNNLVDGYVADNDFPFWYDGFDITTETDPEGRKVMD